MTRLCLLLLALLTLSSLGLVTGQHHARKLFAELERQQERGRQLDVEYGQLQLEASTWAMHARIERVARQSLRMRSPDSKYVQIVAAAPVQASPSPDTRVPAQVRAVPPSATIPPAAVVPPLKSAAMTAVPMSANTAPATGAVPAQAAR